MRTDRAPHIGEYVTKTNAICDRSQIPPRPKIKSVTGQPNGCPLTDEAYWPWFLSTWSQALLNFGRFCWRQARTVKSP